MVEMDLGVFSECVANIDTIQPADDATYDPKHSNPQQSHLPSIQGAESSSRSDHMVINSQMTQQTQITYPNQEYTGMIKEEVYKRTTKSRKQSMQLDADHNDY